MHTYDELTQRIATACLDYAIERLRMDPVSLDGPLTLAALTEQAGTTITREGREPEAVVRQFVDILAPACISTDSTRFVSFIPAAPTKAALLFDLVVGASSVCGTSWLEGSGAVHAENEALGVLADAAGFPAGAGGCFVSGGSVGNLSALAVARDSAAGACGMRRTRWRVAVGEQAHSSIASALRLLDVDALVVASDEHDRLTGPALRAALAADGDPTSICAVVATSGTTNAGIIDDLAGIADVARDVGIWFHVDGAYGAAALLAPSARARFAGIERADSFVVDPHKWLFAPFDSCALLYREPARAKAVHAQDASYLDAIHTGDEWNPADYAFHLTRRTRGLPLWFSLAVHGIDAYSTAVERTLTIARHAATRIAAADHVELVREPELSVVLFRRLGWTESDYTSWSARLLREQVAFCLPSRWKGDMVARAVFLHPECPEAFIDELLATMA
ncbi:MAG: pyridoxal phosphate-dependent decarboxylase family protein [Acidimicrobiia bacterium]